MRLVSGLSRGDDGECSGEPYYRHVDELLLGTYRISTPSRPLETYRSDAERRKRTNRYREFVESQAFARGSVLHARYRPRRRPNAQTSVSPRRRRRRRRRRRPSCSRVSLAYCVTLLEIAPACALEKSRADSRRSPSLAAESPSPCRTLSARERERERERETRAIDAHRARGLKLHTTSYVCHPPRGAARPRSSIFS